MLRSTADLVFAIKRFHKQARLALKLSAMSIFTPLRRFCILKILLKVKVTAALMAPAN